MAKYESKIKAVAASQSTVYARISDLSYLAAIKENINNPIVQEKIPAEHLDAVKKNLENMECTRDTLSAPVGPVGNLAVKIVEREPEKCVKYVSTSSPVSFTLWIQVLPTSDTTSKIKVTLDADINFFMKQVLGKHLQKSVDQLAEVISTITF